MTVKKILEQTVLWSVPLFFLAFGTFISALPYGSGDYGACTYDTCGITLTTDGTVTLPVTPTTSGVNTTVSDTAEVSTDATTGYTLTLSDSDTDTDLISGVSTIAAASGTQASPATLALNTWGYRVDGLAGFGTGPTSAQTSDSSALYTFAGLPASNQTVHTIKTTSQAANPPDTTDVWYGVRVDTTKPNGTYTGTVTYTAVTND